MPFNFAKRTNRSRVSSTRRAGRRANRECQAAVERLELRVLMSTYNLSSYSSTVTDIQTTGIFKTGDAYVNGAANATTGAFQYQSFAVIDFDPGNSTIFPGATVTTPTNLSLTLYNNPFGFNATNGTVGYVASGTFDLYMLATYQNSTTLSFQPTGSPIGLASQAGFSTANPVNYLLGTFTAPSVNGAFTVPLTLPTVGSGTLAASNLLTTDLSTSAPFQIAIVPATAGSYGEFAGEDNEYTNSTDPTNPGNGVAPDNVLDESPQLKLAVNNASESVAVQYANVSANEDNVSSVAELDVIRSGYAGDTATVDWTTANGTALAGTNYGSYGNSSVLAGSLTFAPGQTEATITIPTISAAVNGSDPTDTNFTVSLSAPSATVAPIHLGTQTGGTVTIIGTNNETDAITGNVANNGGDSPQNPTDNGSLGFITSSSGFQIGSDGSSDGTYLPVNGSAQNGTADFDSQTYDVLNFNASALQSDEQVKTLSSLSLVLDSINNYNTTFDGLDNKNTSYGAFEDNTPFPSPNPDYYGDFPIYVITSTPSLIPSTDMYFQGSDPNGTGFTASNGSTSAKVFVGTQTFTGAQTFSTTAGVGTAVLLGVASYSQQTIPTSPSGASPEGYDVGVQDTYTLDLNATAQAFLTAALNASGSSFLPIRLAIAPGSPAFAAEFANSNSGTGGNFGIQPYLWFNGTTQPFSPPAETFAINYSSIDVNSNESTVSVDITRPANSITSDSATIAWTTGNGTALAGTDFGVSGSPVQISGNATFTSGQTVSTISIPIIPDPGLTSERTFTISLTGGSTTGSEPQPTISPVASNIVLVPPVTPTTVAVSDANTALENPGTFNGYAYLNGSTANGTGSFAFQGFQMIEFQPSDFVDAGQQISSITNFSLALTNYESVFTYPSANYSGDPGNFTLYYDADPETTTESATPGVSFNANLTKDTGDYIGTAQDGVGGFAYGTTTFSGVGPMSPSSVVNVDPNPTGSTAASTNVNYLIPLGVVSFNAQAGVDYYTPSTEALNQQWAIPDLAPGGTLGASPTGGTFSALQLMTQQLNAGENIRLIAAPGNTAFHAYFYGAYDNSQSGAGGPQSPTLLVNDTVTNVSTEEQVGFSSSSYAVSDTGTSVTIPVNRSIFSGPAGSDLADTVTVAYSTADGNALNGTNYTSQTGTLTFGPGVTTEPITITLAPNAAQTGDISFSISLSSPTTNDTAHTAFVAPVLTSNSTATVFITDNANNAETLTQYTSSVGDIGTNGPTTFGGSALNPAPPYNFSNFTGGRITALDFNDESANGFNDPAMFNGPNGPLTPTGAPNNLGPTYVPPASEASSGGQGPVVYSPLGDSNYYSSTINAINEIELGVVNYYNSSPGMLLNVYLVSDAGSNILPGAEGPGPNPHSYIPNSTIQNVSPTSGSTYLSDGLGVGAESVSITGAKTGTFTLSYGTQTTLPINYTTASFATTAGNIQSALNALSSISGLGGVTVDSNSINTFTVNFNYAYQGFAPATLASSTTGLTNITGSTAAINVNNAFQFGTAWLLGNVTFPSALTAINEDGYTQIPMTKFDSAASQLLINDLNSTTKFRLVIAPETGNTALNGDFIYNYPVSNAGYADDSGNPLNYYISPELSFDVSYASSNSFNGNGSLPAYITPTANADYLWDPTTGNLTITNGNLTFNSDSILDTTDLTPNITVEGASASITIIGSQHLAGLTLEGGATATLESSNGTGNQVTIGNGTAAAVLSVDSQSSLDIQNNGIVLNYGSASDPIASIASYLAGGSADHWGPGAGTIYSSTVASENASQTKLIYDIGYADGADGIAAGISAGQIEILPTLAGDNKLQGNVVFGDYQELAQYFGQSGGWDAGNFTYGTGVTFGDFQQLAQDFGSSSGFTGTSGGSAPTAPAPAVVGQSNTVFSNSPIFASAGTAGSLDDLLATADSVI